MIKIVWRWYLKGRTLLVDKLGKMLINSTAYFRETLIGSGRWRAVVRLKLTLANYALDPPQLRWREGLINSATLLAECLGLL